MVPRVPSDYAPNLSSVKRLRAWRNLVVAAAKGTQAKGGCPLGSFGGQLVESDQRLEPSSLPDSNSSRRRSAMGSEPFMPTGSSRPTSTPTTSPSRCSPRSKEDFLLAQTQRSARPFETAVDTLLALAFRG